MAAPVIPAISSSFLTPTASLTGGASSNAATGPSFSNFLGQALDKVNAASQNADQMAQSYALGGSVSAAQLMIAESQATLGVDMLSQVTNRVQQAYTTMMNMQV